MNDVASKDSGRLDSPGAQSVLGKVALALGTVVALWFCVRATILPLVDRQYPLIGQALSPSSPVSLATISLNRVSAQNGIADPLARELSAAALRRAPLLTDPFIVAGLDASARGDFTRAERLMEEAKRRDPRSVIPRYWLFDTFLRRGDYARGIAEAGPLMRAQPAAEPAAVAVLTALIPVETARPALVSALAANPVWRRAFFRQAAASPRLRAEAAALLVAVGQEGRAPTSGEQQAIIRGMIAAGNHDDAYAFWLRTLPPRKRPAVPGLYDGGFRGLPGGPPFGWRFPGVRGTVSIVPEPDAPSGSALSIRMGSERAALVAEQLVPVSPGPVRLEFSARALDADMAGDAGLRVELSCGLRGRTIAGTTVRDLGPALSNYAVAATIPERCGTMLVRIRSVPGIEAGSLNALLTGMALVRGE